MNNLSLRSSITVYNEQDADFAYTFLKPLSAEHEKSLIVVIEDAYGEITMQIVNRCDIAYKFNMSEKKVLKLIRELENV
jgi:hypothetical protein